MCVLFLFYSSRNSDPWLWKASWIRQSWAETLCTLSRDEAGSCWFSKSCYSPFWYFTCSSLSNLVFYFCCAEKCCIYFQYIERGRKNGGSSFTSVCNFFITFLWKNKTSSWNYFTSVFLFLMICKFVLGAGTNTTWESLTCALVYHRSWASTH